MSSSLTTRNSGTRITGSETSSVEMISEKMTPRPGNRSRAKAYAAIEWVSNATAVTTTETIAEFNR